MPEKAPEKGGRRRPAVLAAAFLLGLCGSQEAVADSPRSIEIARSMVEYKYPIDQKLKNLNQQIRDTVESGMVGGSIKHFINSDGEKRVRVSLTHCAPNIFKQNACVSIEEELIPGYNTPVEIRRMQFIQHKDKSRTLMEQSSFYRSPDNKGEYGIHEFNRDFSRAGQPTSESWYQTDGLVKSRQESPNLKSFTNASWRQSRQAAAAVFNNYLGDLSQHVEWTWNDALTRSDGPVA